MSFRIARLALVFVVLVFLAAAPTAADCTCVGSSLTCIIINPDGTVGGYIIAKNHPLCIVL